MFEEKLIKHCSPTLAGMKTGNMFSFEYAEEESMLEKIREMNKTLGKKGLRFIPLKCDNGRALIYVFRPGKLSCDLKDSTACKLLSERGYCCNNCGKSVKHLISRINENGDFPHEVGLFLGYPPEDVNGFIENSRNCKCTGCWKVYGDEEKAQKLFRKYKKCSRVYSEQLKKGRPLEKLAVAS